MDGVLGDEVTTAKTCSVCAELRGLAIGAIPRGYAQLIRNRGTEIARSARFALVPSIGALNASHVMVVPCAHDRNLACGGAAASAELREVVVALRLFMLREYGKKLQAFEHGVGHGSDSSGGCVDHAHLHIVEAVPAFQSELAKVVRLVKVADMLAAHEVANQLAGYVYSENEDGVVWVANDPRLPSQYFRKLYAKLAGGPVVWNWRADPRIGEVREVLKTYRVFRAPRSAG